MLTSDPVKRRHRTPSVKQIKAIQLRNQGYSKRRAMIEAGYSINSANSHKDMVFKSRAALDIYESMKESLRSSKLNGDYMARKFEQWMDAQKDDPDDYQIQLQAAKLYKEVMQPAKEVPSNLKRKVTFEEFIGVETKDEKNKL